MKRNLKPAALWFNSLPNGRLVEILAAMPKDAISPFLGALSRTAKGRGTPVSKRRFMQYWNRQYRLGRLPYPAQ